jgi:hypothetical protein
MSGPQFAHIQTWSTKANPAGQSINSIIEEGNREPEFSTHVNNPTPPTVLLGDPTTFRKQHDEHVAVRATVVRKKNGEIANRAIRKDRHTMASIVVSYPKPFSAIISEEDKEKLARWQNANVFWMKEKYGEQLRVVIAHIDEDHPHLHAWLLPDDSGADATTLHPGKQAKQQAEANAKADGLEPRMAVKLGNRALKEAMTAFQDEYYGAVGLPMGLTRSGPKRRRLSREQWTAEKADAAAKSAGLAALEKHDRDIEKRQGDIEERERDIEEREESLGGRERNIDLREGSIEGHERDIEEREERLEGRERDIDLREGTLEEHDRDIEEREESLGGRERDIDNRSGVIDEMEDAFFQAEAVKEEATKILNEALTLRESVMNAHKKMKSFIHLIAEKLGVKARLTEIEDAVLSLKSDEIEKRKQYLAEILVLPPQKKLEEEPNREQEQAREKDRDIEPGM